MKRCRRTAFCIAMVFGLTACGGAATTDVGSSMATSTASEAQMGRWVESEVDIGGREVAGEPTLLEDGSLVMFVYPRDPASDESGAVRRLTSKDNGETWTEDDPGWNDQVEGSIYRVWMAPDGTACLGSMVRDEESRANNNYSLYLQKPGEPLEPLEFENADQVHYAIFYQKDLLLFSMLHQENSATTEMTAYDLETGELNTISLEGEANYSGGIQPNVVGDKLMYLYYSGSTIPLMELNPQDGTSTQILDSLSEATFTNALVGAEDGSLYYPTSKGIYRLASGGTLPEQIMAADGTALSVISNYPSALCKAANGDFLVTLLGDDSSRKIYRYHYDETLPTHADTALTVWSLQESATARAAINLYKQQHPEIDVAFTTAIPEDAQDPRTARNDALTQLNTELLAGEGPDLLILDGVDYETYAEKGLLADLEDALPLDSLQSNLTDAFVQDGKLFAMPCRFTVPVWIGDEGSLEGITDLSDIQQAVLDAAPRPDFGTDSPDFYESLPEEQKYAFALTSAEDFADFLLPVTANAILQKDSLDEDALRQVMTFVQTVSDYYGIRNYTMKNDMGSIQSWSGSDPITTDYKQGEYSNCSHAKYGWFDMDTPYSIITMARKENPVDYSSPKISCEIALRPGLTSGAYTPETIVGVNAGSSHLDAAKELAAVFFDAAVQGTYYSDGMTVRADCLKEKVDNVIASDSYPADLFRGDIQALLESCTTPVIVPTVLRDSFLEHAEAIIQGQESADDAVKGIQSDLSLYLAEQQ